MNYSALFLRLESIVILAAATVAYVSLGYNGWLFLLLFFTPDVSIIGYLVNSKVGALTYNLIHNFSLPLILCGLGFLFRLPIIEAYALIWTAHVAFDRTIGFGLNYPDRFGHTNIADINIKKLVARFTWS